MLNDGTLKASIVCNCMPQRIAAGVPTYHKCNWQKHVHAEFTRRGHRRRRQVGDEEWQAPSQPGSALRGPSAIATDLFPRPCRCREPGQHRSLAAWAAVAESGHRNHLPASSESDQWRRHPRQPGVEAQGKRKPSRSAVAGNAHQCAGHVVMAPPAVANAAPAQLPPAPAPPPAPCRRKRPDQPALLFAGQLDCTKVLGCVAGCSHGAGQQGGGHRQAHPARQRRV